MKQHFTKIRWDGAEVEIHWFTIAGDDEIHHELASSESPEASLGQSLMAFVPKIVAMLALPAEYADMEVTSLSIRHDKGKRGLVVTGKKAIEGLSSPFVIHTPYVRLATADDDEGSEASALVQQLTELLDKAEAQAHRFLAGKRSQGDLFEETVDDVAEAVTA